MLKVLCGVLAGLLVARLFVIYHDFQHGAILKGSIVGAIIMKGFGLLTLAPSSIWNETHQHHHHSNSKFSSFVMGSFPTITTRTYLRLSKSQKFKYRMIRHPLMIAFAYIPIFLVSFCLWPFFENPKKYYDCGLAALVHGLIAHWLFVSGGAHALLYFLLIPSFVTFSIGGYIFYAQHNFPEVILRNDDEWDYLDAALCSSSFIRMNRLMRWFTANIGYHHIHHVNSRIPFYHLPLVMNHFQELQQPRSTSLHPKEIWKCLQLKFWDEERGRMISMKEMKSRVSGFRPISV
jgi:omega-6 fatty acid desaturase (delta-12 desaturase)